MQKYRYTNQTKFKNNFFVQCYVHVHFLTRRKSLRARHAHAYERARNFPRPDLLSLSPVRLIQLGPIIFLPMF